MEFKEGPGTAYILQLVLLVLLPSKVICTEPAVQGCKQEKYLERLFTPLVASFNAIRQAFQPTRAEIWHKICKFYLSAKIHASRILFASTKGEKHYARQYLTLNNNYLYKYYM